MNEETFSLANKLSVLNPSKLFSMNLECLLSVEQIKSVVSLTRCLVHYCSCNIDHFAVQLF